MKALGPPGCPGSHGRLLPNICEAGLCHAYLKAQQVFARHAHVPYAYATHVQACHEKRLELGCFEMLQQQEALARPQRLAQMGTLVSEQSVREAQLQAEYAELLRKRDSLLEQLKA